MTTSIALTLTLAWAGNPQGQFPVGSYRPDLSRTPKNSRDPLAAYFGRAYLVIRANGSFELCGIEQKGFWRGDKARYILNYDGFFFVRAKASPDEVRRMMPSSNLEGMVLKPGPGNTLVLKDWGSVRGPVIFRPMPRRNVTELIRVSNTDDHHGREAFEAVMLRREGDWDGFLRIAADAKEPWRLRSWAALLLRGVKSPQAVESTARLISNLKSTENGREGTIRRNLAEVVAEHPTKPAVVTLLGALERGLIDASVVAKAMAELKDREYIPVLIKWLSSSREYDRLETLEALTIMDAVEALPMARDLTEDPKESVQLKAYGLIARLSPDPAERTAAIHRVAKWIKSSHFLLPFSAVDALCASNHPDALPYLVAILLSDLPAINRRNTAYALGKLGDPRAVPALLEAKNRRYSMDNWAIESEAQRAAVEALIAIEKGAKSASGG